MAHAFKPCSGDCGRCAVCLRSLDCAPHLPLAPSPTWPLSSRGPRIRMTNGNPLREYGQFSVSRPARGAVQGGR